MSRASRSSWPTCAPRGLASIRKTILRLEGLEDRCLPAAPFVQTGGIVTASAPLAHRYDFSAGLGDILGGPALVSHGGTVGGGRYTFAAQQGLQLNGGLVNTSNYSIEMIFKYDAVTPFWKKFIDFAQLTSDNGMYVSGNTLTLYPGSTATGTVAAGTDFHFILTRNAATGDAKIYLNGALQFTYTGTPSAGAVSATNTLIFFQDDTHTSGLESQAGSVDVIAIYNGVLSPTDVSALSQTSALPLPTSVSVQEGQTASMNGVFHDAGTGNVTVTSSVGTISQSTGSHGAWSWSYLADDGPSQTQTVVITATNGGGVSSQTSFSLNVSNVAPTGILTNNGPVSEGSTGSVSFMNVVDPSSADTASLHYAFDFDNDGVFEVGDGTYAGSFASASATVPVNFLADGPGTRTVHGRVLDKDGGCTDATTTITIYNAPPTLSAASAAVRGDEGGTVSNSGSFGDPGVDTVFLSASVGTIHDDGNGTWSWSFATSDGPDQSQTVTITATDSDGAQTSLSFSLTVDKVAPSVGMNNASVSVDEGQTASNGGLFGDVGADTVSLSASVGSVHDNGNGTWSWSFASSDGPSQSQAVTITATDSDGAQTSVSFGLVVNNVAPTMTSFTLAPSAPSTLFPGSAVAVLGAFSDPGTADLHHAVITWGDGTQTVIGESDADGINQSANTFATKHAYAAAGFYTITAAVYDADGGADTRTLSIRVAGAVVRDGVLQIIGTDKADRVVVERLGLGDLKVHANFLGNREWVAFLPAGVARIVADLGDGDDSLTLAGNLTLPSLVHGGNGNDCLNGGAGPSVLLGDAGNDTLQGGGGRDLLIGGLGSDRLLGGKGDDVLIAGFTGQDDDPAALWAALAAWTGPRSAADRTAQLNTILTAYDDGVVDRINGNSKWDLIYSGAGDMVNTPSSFRCHERRWEPQPRPEPGHSRR